MSFISTDHRDYLTPEGPSGRPLRARVRAYAVRAIARMASLMMIAFGITFIGYGAGFASAWVLGLLFTYPISETMEWLAERVRDGRTAA